MKKCENCKKFYECDNTGAYTDCLPDMKYYEECTGEKTSKEKRDTK